MNGIFRSLFLTSVLTLFFLIGNSFAQTFPNDSLFLKAKAIYQSIERLERNSITGVPQSIRGKLISNINLNDITQAKQFLRNSKALFRLNEATDDFAMKKIEKDELGMSHAKLQQTYKGIPVWGSELILHGDRNNTVIEVNGRFTPDLDVDATPTVSASNALNIALADLGPADYRWQNAEQEKIIRQVFKDSSKTWKPNPEVIITPRKGDFDKGEYRLAWKITIAVDGAKMGNWEYFVDAKTGEIINKFNSLPDAVGSGVSNYNGTVTIYSHWTSSNYQMIDTIRNIKTYNYDGTVPGTLLTDNDNYWDQNNSAVDVHWGIGNVYDFYKNVFNRNSFDNAGAQIVNTVNYPFPPDNGNAQWTGSQMEYGAGNGLSFSSVTSLDICGHELTHAVTQYTAALIYQGESGALNEAISDIFGTAIEFYATPSKADWWIGEDCYTLGISNDALRYMDNPNRGQQPDTYEGTYWASTSGGDYGGVHTNGGVLNYAFYLMTVGGSGTNDNGTSFNVTGVWLNKTRAIAYRALTVYLTSSSNYADACAAFLSSATDLYGSGGAEVAAVRNAFYAVGVEPNLIIANSFSAGTIMVNGTTVNSGYSYPADVGSSQTYQAIPQPSGSYDYVWNTSGVDPSISYWKKQPYLGSQSRISGATNISYSFTAASSDNNATYIADLKKNFHISRNDQTDFDGTILRSNVVQIVEGNSATVPAPSTQTINNHNYAFMGWANGANGSVTPTDNMTYPNAATYHGVHLTGTSTALSNTSQRKIVRVDEGYLFLVYESANRVWLERSADGGATWTLCNNNQPVDNGPQAKQPAIDYLTDLNYPGGGYGSDEIYITFQQQSGSNYTIQLARFDDTGQRLSANQTIFTSSSAYSNNATPVVSVNWYERSMWEKQIVGIWKEPAGLYWYAAYYNGSTFTWNDPVNKYYQITGTSSASVNPTINVYKYDLYARQYGPMYFFIAWEQNGQSIKYGKVTCGYSGLTASGALGSFYSFLAANYRPSIIATKNDSLRLCWNAYLDNPIDTPPQSILTNPLNSSVYWALGSNVTSTNMNKSYDDLGGGANNRFAVGWTQNPGSGYSNYAMKSTALSSPINLNSNGKDMQLHNGYDFSTIRGVLLSTSTPYAFMLSNAVGTGLQKESNEEISKGRTAVLSLADSTGTSFYFTIGDVFVDGQRVDFTELTDTTEINTEEQFSTNLTSKLFTITDASSFTYDVQYGATDSAVAVTALGRNNFVHFTLELLDASTGRTIGSLNNASYDTAHVAQWRSAGC